PPAKKSSSALPPVANHVSRTSNTSPSAAMIDLGPAVGKVGISYTTTYENKNPGLFYSYSDSSTSGSSVGVGVGDLCGIGVGAGNDINVFAERQFLFLQDGASIGLDGFGISAGLNWGNNAIDFEFKIGLGAGAAAIGAWALKDYLGNLDWGYR
ncbi:MAG: hypothetical protein FWD16_06050, partial [Clostridia bacterium]|nr:hypothetical protein [Clostridia bacterium]